MLKVRDLSVFEHASPLVNNITLDVKRGEIIALIGTINSGKSALLGAIAGGYPHFDGEIKVGSYSMKTNPLQAKSQLGYLGSPPALEAYLTGLEWLETVGAVYQLPPKTRIASILQMAEKFGVKDDLYTVLERVGAASQQKIGLIASLFHQPMVALWDEPIRSLDPLAQDDLIQTAREYIAGGGAVLCATNHLDWAQDVADRFICLHNGELIAEGTMPELRNLARTDAKKLSAVFTTLVHDR